MEVNTSDSFATFGLQERELLKGERFLIVPRTWLGIPSVIIQLIENLEKILTNRIMTFNISSPCSPNTKKFLVNKSVVFHIFGKSRLEN